MGCYFGPGHKGTMQRVEVKGLDGKVVMVFEGEICDRDAKVLGTVSHRKEEKSITPSVGKGLEP